jgi:hypothetical protein
MCYYIATMKLCRDEGMLCFLECSSYFLVDELILLFVTLVEILGL